MSNDTNNELLTTNRKALRINLDDQKYGTFAEIGAGQETARNFFHAGGAAGTIAKTISAYDMTFSDSIYGKAGRYVSRKRLETMLDHEYGLLEERLSEKVGKEKTFFAFANTVKAKGYRGGNDAHGWLGIRFQATPETKPNDIILHARMWDNDNLRQQEAIGILGTNLIYGALKLANNPDELIKSLIDNLGPERIEIDLIYVSGEFFKDTDNRIMNLNLVNFGLTNAVLFNPEGEIMQPSEVFYKKAILVERGSFRPVSKVNIDMLKCSGAQFIQEPQVQDKEVVALAEITMNNLLAGGTLDIKDFLDRIDTLAATGNYVLISNYFEFYRLTAYFRRFTQEMIGVAMGINNLLEVFNSKYYTNLQGGILENFGRLFRNSVKLYIYPMKQRAYRQYKKLMSEDTLEKVDLDEKVTTGGITDDMLITCGNLKVATDLSHLYDYLLENGFIEPIKGVNEELLEIFSRDVLTCIAEGDASWENMVPAKAVEHIKKNKLFGYTSD
ncbi:TonB-dependent receptor [Puniceicoccaceae bacterium K14]|nr:TonB-dependent receptor [Puniceicoccaceae bacterium K14]